MPWSSEPVTTTSKFQASGVIWPMINQNALALLIQNKMMPAPSSTNPNPSTDPRLQALPPSPQHPQETPQLISLDRWKYCLAGAEASTRSMTRKDLHDFASRCPPHPSHGVVWPCQNGMTWVKALPLCHFCKWLTEKQKSNEPSSRREEVFRNHVFITWSLSAPPLPQDPTTGQSTFRMPKYPFHFLQVLSKALHPLNLDCLALEGPSKHWTSDPSPLFHILLRWKLVTLGSLEFRPFLTPEKIKKSHEKNYPIINYISYIGNRMLIFYPTVPRGKKTTHVRLTVPS